MRTTYQKKSPPQKKSTIRTKFQDDFLWAAFLMLYRKMVETMYSGCKGGREALACFLIACEALEYLQKLL